MDSIALCEYALLPSRIGGLTLALPNETHGHMKDLIPDLPKKAGDVARDA